MEKPEIDLFEKETPNEEEQIINNGFGKLIKNKTLFHGSSISGIKKFNTAEETTVGEGIYFTSKKNDAEKYAEIRSKSSNSAPIIYSADIENLKFFDATKESNVVNILKDILEILEKELKDPELSWIKQGSLSDTINKIKTGKIHFYNLREIGFSHGKIFTEYIKSLGYDGLIAIEGGEGEILSNHDTYLIFDPEKVNNVKELKNGH